MKFVASCLMVAVFATAQAQALKPAAPQLPARLRLQMKRAYVAVRAIDPLGDTYAEQDEHAKREIEEAEVLCQNKAQMRLLGEIEAYRLGREACHYSRSGDEYSECEATARRESGDPVARKIGAL